MNQDYQKAMAAALATVIMWASTYVGIRLAAQHISPEVLALYRFLIASLLLGLYLYLKKMGLPKRKDLPLIVLTGFIGIFCYQVLFNYGQKMVSAGTGAFLFGLSPLFTALNAFFFLRERLSFAGWMGIFVSFSGVGLICLGENGGNGINNGVFILVGTAFIFSFYNILVRKLCQTYSSIQVTSFAFISGTLFMLIFTPGLMQEFPAITLRLHLTVVYLAVFPAALGYFLWSFAIGKGNPGQISSFVYLSPFFTLLIGWIWLKEIPHWQAILGGIIVIAGVCVTNFMGKVQQDQKNGITKPEK